MKIKKFNESNNEDFVSIEDIEEFFYDWTDEELKEETKNFNYKLLVEITKQYLN
jgi:hypothetical protein